MYDRLNNQWITHDEHAAELMNTSQLPVCPQASDEVRIPSKYASHSANAQNVAKLDTSYLSTAFYASWNGIPLRLLELLHNKGTL